MLAQQGRLRELVDFASFKLELYPDSFDLARMVYFSARDIEEIYRAAGIILHLFERGQEEQQALIWFKELCPLLQTRNESLLDRAAQLEGSLSVRISVGLMLAYGDAIAAERRFLEYLDSGANDAGYAPSTFAEYLFDFEFYEYAERYFLKAIEREPENLKLLCKLVETLLELSTQRCREKAAEALDLAEALFRRYPEAPEVWYVLGLSWLKESRPDRAFPFLDRFFEAFPEHPRRSGFTFDLAYLENLTPEEFFRRRCDWSKVSTILTRSKSSIPLHCDFDPNRRIRIGYVSADFGKHPVGYFCQTILKHHDPSQFEVFLYAQRNPLGQDDEITRDFRSWVGEDHWRWTYQTSAGQLLAQVREDRIDVLVDLAGHSAMNRLDLFGNRGAPVQVGWLGDPGTSGLSEIDYRISDDIVEPRGEADRLSAEKICRLPHGFHAIGFSDDIPEPVPPPCLKNGYITFGSFNNCNKMGSKTVALWARVLREIPQARLLLKHQTMEFFASRESFRSLFAAEGVDPTRIRFEGTTVSRDAHFACYEKMDVALDPVAYNGTTTTCEALYMGVPVLTRMGTSHASRVSSSLLHRMGMDGWVAKSDDEFVHIAKAAAARPDALEKRRAGMRAAYLASPLNDGLGMARDLETAFRQMWQETCAEKNSGPKENNTN